MSERFAKNTFYGVVAALCGSLGSFATTIVVARLLGVSETGAVNFALWVVSLASAATDLGVYASLARYLPELTRSESSVRAQRFSGYLLLPFAAVTLLGLAAFVVFAFFVHETPEFADRLNLDADARHWVLIGVMYVAHSFSNFSVGYFQGMQRFEVAAKFASYTALVRLVGAAVGAYSFGVLGALLGYLAALAVATPVPFLVSCYRGRIPDDLRRRVIRYASFSWASTFAAALIVARPEVAFLNYFQGKEAVGYYASAFTLASLAVQGPMLLTAGLVPYFSENASSGGRLVLEKMMYSGTRIMALMILPMTFGTAAIADQLLPILYGDAFSPAITPAVILIASSCLSGNTVLFSGLIIGMERSDFTFYLNLSGAILTILIALVIIPNFGTAGAAFGRAIVQLYMFCVSAWFVVCRLKYHLPFRQLIKLIFAAAGCAAVARSILYFRPDVVGMLLAVGASAIIYLFLVRILGGIDISDVDRLKNLSNSFPKPLRLVLSSIFGRLAVRA